LVDSTYLHLKSQPYRLAFKPDFFTVRVDNNVLFTKYQSVAYNGGQYSQPNLGGMLTMSLNDALENHRVTGGFRIPFNRSGMAYFLQYENFMRRLDWGILFLRTESTQVYNVSYTDQAGTPVLVNQQIGKVSTNILMGSIAYPLSRVRSIRLHMGVRQDALNFKSTDTLSLSFSPRRRTYWAMSRLEYVFDNTTPLALNIRRGMRFKFFGEYLYQLSKPNGGFYNIGGDIRNYHRVYKNIIVANRIAFAHSGGNQQINYLLGGVDNAIFAKQTGIPPAQDQTYAFQALATNLRGYDRNSLAGNTYLLFNSEIRMPVFTTFLKRPIQSGFLRNLQAVAFVDAGNAWNGLLPTTDALTRNFSFYNNNSGIGLQVSLPPQSIAVGYGVGLRTMVFGYFMRLDAAWNIEARRYPLLHLSIGTDF
jgi:hypothetical protein